MAAPSDASLLSQLPRAMLHALPVVLAVGTVIAGAIHPLLAIPGALAWAIATGVIASRRAAAKAQPDVGALPPSLQADLLGVTSALDHLQEAVRAVPNEQRVMFEGIERESEEVRDSVLQLGVTAGTLHRHLEATRPNADAPEENSERRERLLGQLERYRATIHSLETTAEELADRAVDLAGGGAIRYDELDATSPERKISEMKASMAALEEVLRADVEQM